MKRISTCLAFVAAIYVLTPSAGIAQRGCGNALLMEKLNAENPAQLQEMRKQRDLMIEQALTSASKNGQTAAQAPIPLAFHFVITQAEYYKLGTDSGIKRRVNSQIAALNRDYGGTNTDKAKIPTPFKSLFATVGLQFALANVTTANTIAAGIEVRIVTSPPKYDVTNSCANAKRATDGLPGWDNSKFLNIWVANIWGGSVNNTILGVAVPPSFVGQGAYTSEDLGIVLNYATIGAREFAAQFFNVPTVDRGRTLTHEMGHYFELWHIWGDDGGLCPSTGGYDDGISDTPPQADATYCDNVGKCPSFPKTDGCSGGNGIMFMNYMDYVDDSAMFMFTTQQANVIKSHFGVGGESYSLTQNPSSLYKLDVENATLAISDWSVSPNPATGAFHLNLDNATGFKGAVLLNMMGQAVANISARPGVKQYDLDLSTTPRGIYLVQCQYEGGTTTKKLVLE